MNGFQLQWTVADRREYLTAFGTAYAFEFSGTRVFAGRGVFVGATTEFAERRVFDGMIGFAGRRVFTGAAGFDGTYGFAAITDA
jgi:hypothetical protein